MLGLASLATQDEQLESRFRSLAEQLDLVLTTHKSPTFINSVLDTPADLILVDRSALPTPWSTSLQTLLTHRNHPAVVLVSDKARSEERVFFRLHHCDEVLNLTLGDTSIKAMLAMILERRRDRQTQILHNRPRVEQAIQAEQSKNPEMQAFLTMAKKVARSDSSILIQGETGVGKERLARAIHNQSHRSSGPFIPITLAAFPETLLESELFGNVKGAYTGASQARRGCFELAQGGTILLDELGDLPKHLQVKLLRVLQERTIQRLGSESIVPVDVRIIAATNRDLQEDSKSGEFREDLYYRIGVVTLEIPALRNRKEDIPGLAHEFLEQRQRGTGKSFSGFTPEAIECLCQYAWPGNVRELLNVVERTVLLAEGEIIDVADLPPRLSNLAPHVAATTSLGQNLSSTPWESKPWKTARDGIVTDFEKMYFTKLLEKNDGSLKLTAQDAGLNPRSVYEILKRHRLDRTDFKKA